jgi:hypothetical protein
MPTFEFCLAQNVRAYGSVEVEADTAEEAIEKLRADALSQGGKYWGDVFEVEWDTANGDTIVSMTCDGHQITADLELTEDAAPCQVLSADVIAAEIKRRRDSGEFADPPAPEGEAA